MSDLELDGGRIVVSTSYPGDSDLVDIEIRDVAGYGDVLRGMDREDAERLLGWLQEVLGDQSQP